MGIIESICDRLRQPSASGGKYIETGPLRRIDERFFGGAAGRHFAEAAFDQIMADVDAPSEIVARLRPYFAAAHRSGNPSKKIAVLQTAFRDISWGEAYFDAWRGRVMAGGIYPLMWRRQARTLIEDTPSPPCAIGCALEYLTVADMRQLLADLGAMPESYKPTERAELEQLLRATGNTSAIIRATLPRYESALINLPAIRQRQKCAILAHTLSMRARALQDRHVRSWPHNGLFANREQKLRPEPGDCPVETAFAAKYTVGEILGEPPFFPGDRTRLVIEQQGTD